MKLNQEKEVTKWTTMAIRKKDMDMTVDELKTFLTNYERD